MDSLRDSFTLDIDQFQFVSLSQQSSTIPTLAPRGESGYSYHDTTSHHSQPGTSQHNVVMSYPRMNNVAKASQLLTAISPGATSHPQPVIGAAKPLVASKLQSDQMKSLDISVNSPNSPDMPNELDYPHAAYWTREEWDSFRDDQKISGLHTTNSRRIRLKDLSLPNHSLAYITNEANMYKHYPDLRLCEGHWKLNLFATQEYPAFTCALKNRGNVKEEPESDNSSSPIPKTPKKCMHASSDKPARNVKKTKVNHPVPGTAGPSSGSTCAVAIPASTSKGSPIVSLTSSSFEIFLVQPCLLDTLCSTLPVSISPSASAPLPLSPPVQPLKSTIKDNLLELISASPLTPNEVPDIHKSFVSTSSSSVELHSAFTRYQKSIYSFPIHLHQPRPLNNASKCKKNLDDAVWKPSPIWNSANNLFGIDYIHTHPNASKINVRLAFEGLSAPEKKVYADRGAYNKKNKIPLSWTWWMPAKVRWMIINHGNGVSV
ncbi:hypothetical protein JB92DRAFT_3102757 [Gautieria morchelliformis]|nr:hypothetical protein JB92DRAFT_3102757 [Gautieria morchelliformis]